jgi:hypothetical protein
MNPAHSRSSARISVHDDYAAPNLIRIQKIAIKEGPCTYKTAALLYLGDKESGVVKSKVLQLRSYSKRADGTYDFDNPDQKWYCTDAEVTQVQAFLNSELSEAGTYQLVAEGSDLHQLIQQIESGRIEPAALQSLLNILSASRDAQALLADSEAGRILASAIQLRQQSVALERLRAVVENSVSTELNIQRQLEDQWWIFGGRFINMANRRGITVLDQLDVPLIRADGSLHIVELKKANVPNLIRLHRNHLIVGEDVHEAVSQCENYLRSLDENRASILTDLGMDCRRASATVVIGHPKFQSGYSEQEICETFRTYNSHLSRIEVISYKELLDGASRSLALQG